MVGAPKFGMMAGRRSTIMVKRKRQVHTRAFKEQAVALAKGSARSLADVARGLGVPPGTLAYWVDHPPADAAAARAAAKRGRAAALADEHTADPVALRLQLDEARARIRVL